MESLRKWRVYIQRKRHTDIAVEVCVITPVCVRKDHHRAYVHVLGELSNKAPGNREAVQKDVEM